MTLSRARVKPISVKRKNDNVLRAEMMEAKYGPRPWRCMFFDYAGNVFQASDAIAQCHGEVNGHEIIKASQWRAGRLVPSNVITLCNFHNGFVEDFPDKAHKLGLMKHEWERHDKI
jgi:hypothetical protein